MRNGRRHLGWILLFPPALVVSGCGHQDEASALGNRLEGAGVTEVDVDYHRKGFETSESAIFDARLAPDVTPAQICAVVERFAAHVDDLEVRPVDVTLNVYQPDLHPDPQRWSVTTSARKVPSPAEAARRCLEPLQTLGGADGVVHTGLDLDWSGRAPADTVSLDFSDGTTPATARRSIARAAGDPSKYLISVKIGREKEFWFR
ncbi:MAG: hypothetical protein ABWX96_21915 [Propionibacteriaceae bacterium]